MMMMMMIMMMTMINLCQSVVGLADMQLLKIYHSPGPEYHSVINKGITTGGCSLTFPNSLVPCSTLTCAFSMLLSMESTVSCCSYSSQINDKR